MDEGSFNFGDGNYNYGDGNYNYGEGDFKYGAGNASTIETVPHYNRSQSSKLGKSRQWLVNLLMIGLPILLCVILLIILMHVPDMTRPSPPYTRCIPSEESKKSGLMENLQKIQSEFYRLLYPEKIYMKPGVTPEEIRAVFRPWDPTPSTIKFKTDEAAKLLKELNSLKINTKLLKIRERKAIHVAKAILLNNYGWAPYGQNYYSGDWMFGPDLWCWHPVCFMFSDLSSVIEHFKPRNASELRKLDDLFDKFNNSMERYMENLNLGVLTGYVRNKQACMLGIHNLHYFMYRNIALENETGVYNEAFASTVLAPGFFDDVSKDDKKKWKEEHGEDILAYFNRSLVTKIGRPTKKMLRYVEGEHVFHCAPETVASGLEKLPLSYGYDDEITNTSIITTKKLPTGERLVGKDTYRSLLKYFTTLDITPEKLRERAEKNLNVLYEQAVELAKEYTGVKNNKTAIDRFVQEVQDQDMYFNDQPFPAKESGSEAFINCNDAKSAEANCPERHKAMTTWIKNSVEVKDLIRTKYLKDVLYDEGPKNCIPKCSMDIVPWYQPHAVFHAYSIGNKDCSFKASQSLPFFLPNYGPKWVEYSVVAHEFAGHHIEVQSYTEYFQSNCTDPIAWLNAPNFFPAITEGWAAYVEGELFTNDTTFYSLKPGRKGSKENKEIMRQKYGMLYYQLLHAVRAIVDIDLHYYGKPLSDMLELYRKYTWEDNNHLVNKDIQRIQSMQGLVTSYTAGLTEILRVRSMVERELGEKFSLKDFHYEILREGEFPLDYLEEHMEFYIACKKDSSQEGCEEFV